MAALQCREAFDIVAMYIISVADSYGVYGDHFSDIG